MRRAAVDIGTMTARLLLAEVVDGRVDEIARRTRITRLGEGLHDAGHLTEAALERTLSAVRGFVAEALTSGAEDTVVVATSAARDAANSQELLDGLRDFGVEPRIISGPEEARLSFAGATHSLEGEGILLADPGGGSTELVLGDVIDRDGVRRSEIHAARSIDVGSSRATDMFLASDPPSRDELQRAAEWMAEEFRPFFDSLRDERPRMMVSVAGTATSLAAIKLGLEPYDPDRVHLSALTGADLADLRHELASMTLARRRAVPGLEPDRAPVIVAGAMTLETLVGLAGLDSTLVSEHDILYGLVLEGAPAAR